MVINSLLLQSHRNKLSLQFQQENGPGEAEKWAELKWIGQG